MASLEKQRRRWEAEKKAKEVMSAQSFKEAMKEQEIRSTANAIGRLAFIACEYLENKHGYKKLGLIRFLNYLADCIDYTGEDEDFFLTQDKYYKEIHGLDVLAELGLGLKVE